MRVIWFLLLAACAPRALSIGPDHPANPAAETGRLAGPPPALRPGVVTPERPPAQPRKDHTH
jgi:hypothetical protein